MFQLCEARAGPRGSRRGTFEDPMCFEARSGYSAEELARNTAGSGFPFPLASRSSSKCQALQKADVTGNCETYIHISVYIILIILLDYIILYDIILYYIILYYIILIYIVLYCIILYYIRLYHTISYYIILY